VLGGWIRPEEVECPSLAALLHGECQAAARIARQTGREERAEHWRRKAEAVHRALERMKHRDGYRTQDRETHASPAGRKLWEGPSGGKLESPIVLKEAARVIVRCAGGRETRPVVEVVLCGRDARGAACEEKLLSDDFSWLRGAGVCFSRAAWMRIDEIRPAGPSAGMTFRLDIPDLRREDLSNFLPLWSRSAPSSDAERLFARLAEGSGFDSPAGLLFAPGPGDAAGGEGGGVWMFWNMLMGEAAIRYGRGELALEWIGRWMDVLSGSLRTDGSFRSAYEPRGPGGAGPRNSLQGIFPPGLFLAALGVHPVASNRVWAGGRSVFPFQITVRYRGMTVVREGDLLRVRFPSGRRREFRGTDRTLITDSDGSP
jgi:hypothetical protein